MDTISLLHWQKYYKKWLRKMVHFYWFEVYSWTLHSFYDIPYLYIDPIICGTKKKIIWVSDRQYSYGCQSTNQYFQFRCMMMSFIIMQFIFYFTFTIIRFENHSEIPALCQFEALLVQYSQMSAFFWLNAMAHNIYLRLTLYVFCIK